jgi:hypothetical protein
MLTSSSSLLRGAGILRRLPLLVNLPSSRCRSCHRLVSSTTATTTTTNNTAAALLLQEPDPSLVDAASAPSDFDNSATVYRDFVTPQDGAILLADLIAKLKRYERVETAYHILQVQCAIANSHFILFVFYLKQSTIRKRPLGCRHCPIQGNGAER